MKRKALLSRGGVVSLFTLLAVSSFAGNTNNEYFLKYSNGKEVNIEKVLKENNGAVALYPLPKTFVMQNFSGKEYRKFNKQYGHLGKPLVFGKDSYFGGVSYTYAEAAAIELCEGNCKIVSYDGKTLNNLPRELSIEVTSYILGHPNKDKVIYDLTDKFENAMKYGGNGSGTSNSSSSSSSSSSSESSSGSSSGSSGGGVAGVHFKNFF